MKKYVQAVNTVLISFVVLSLCSWANASDLDVTDYGDKMPSTEDFIMALDPEMRVRTRSLSASEPVKKRSVSLGIQFKRSSFELTESAQDVLNRLGGALASPQLSEHRFLIEGHTDASGGNEYNQELSDQRALTVKNYLVNVFDISPSRLENVGRGETALLDDTDPYSSVNRRVQIINLAQ